MEYSETVTIALIGFAIVFFIVIFLTRKTKAEKEHEQRLKESLADELIYDPETGVSITLEEAESSIWLAHNNLNRIKSKEEIDKYYFGQDKSLEEFVNNIKSAGYISILLSDAQIDFLNQSYILSKYDNWSCDDSFTLVNNEHIILLPEVVYEGNKQQNSYSESQIMFWVQHTGLTGHIYLRNKTNVEAFTDMISSDDEIKLNNYESFVFKRTTNEISLMKMLKLFEDETGLEIEINDGNLLIKTLKLANLTDFERIKNIIKKQSRL